MKSICKNRGYHNWSRDKQGKSWVNFDSVSEDYCEIDGHLACHDCGAVAYLKGEFDVE